MTCCRTCNGFHGVSTRMFPWIYILQQAFVRKNSLFNACDFPQMNGKVKYICSSNSFWQFLQNKLNNVCYSMSEVQSVGLHVCATLQLAKKKDCSEHKVKITMIRHVLLKHTVEANVNKWCLCVILCQRRRRKKLYMWSGTSHTRIRVEYHWKDRICMRVKYKRNAAFITYWMG